MVKRNIFMRLVFAFLMVNMATSVFAVPVMDYTVAVESSPVITLNEIVMSGGVDEVEGNIPPIIMDGGITSADYMLPSTYLTGGKDVVVKTLPSIVLSGGSDGVKYEGTIEVQAGLLANQVDNEITIDGVTIPLGVDALSANEIAFKIAEQIYNNYDVSLEPNNIILFKALNIGVNGSLPLFDSTDLTYNDISNNLLVNDKVLGDDSRYATDVLSITRRLAVNPIDDVLEIDGITINLGSDLSLTEIAQKIVDESLNFPSVTAEIVDVNDVKFSARVSGFTGDGEVISNDLSYTNVNPVAASASITLNVPMPANHVDTLVVIDGIEINFDESGLSVNEMALAIEAGMINSTNYIVNAQDNIVTFTSKILGESENNKEVNMSDDDYTGTAPVYAKASITILDSLTANAKDSTINIAGVTIDLGSNALTAEMIADMIANYSFPNYDVSDILETVTFTYKIDNINYDTLNVDSSYTKVNSENATGSVTIVDALVSNAQFTELNIDEVPIELGMNALTVDEIVFTIVSQNFTTVTANAINNTIYFISTQSGSSGDTENLASDLSYGGKSQVSSLTLGEFESGFTYDFLVGEDEINDIVTPENTTNFVELISNMIAEIPGVYTTFEGDVINIITDEIGTSFDLEINGASNSAPTVANVRVTGEIQAGETVVCNYDYFDLEGDAEDVSIINWFIDDELVLEDTYEYVLDVDNVDSVVSCTVTPFAVSGVKQGLTIESLSVEVSLRVILISNGVMFSVPTCVDSIKMINEAQIDETDVFSSYTNGMWESFGGEFDVLKGYKYFGNREFELPVYVDDDCDFTQIKTTISNNWNLIGPNSLSSVYAEDLLWSLTKRSYVETFIDALYNNFGVKLGSYDSNDFGLLEVSPMEAYWIFYAGEDGTLFSGTS